MRTYLRKIAALVVVTLVTSGFAVANNGPAEEIQNAVEVKAREAELEQQSRAEVAAVLAQAQASGPTIPRPIPSPAPAPPTEPASGAAANIRLQLDRLSATQDRLSLRAGRAGAVLVVPTAEIKTEDILAITEDMSVMSRIFERNLERARIGAAGTSLFNPRQDVLSRFLVGGRQTTQSMYLQGYGALFLMAVDFPLSPGPQVQEEKQTQEDEDVDQVWERTRIEMYEPEKVDRRRRTDRPQEKYDGLRVENFKTTLIKALKHAANIRSLKPDESVVITVTGSGGSATLVGEATSAKTKIFVVGSDGETRIIQEPTSRGAALFPTVLVMRARKSDIDEFAKGDLDLDQFRQRVQVLACPYLGGVVRGAESDPLQIQWGQSEPDQAL